MEDESKTATSMIARKTAWMSWREDRGSVDGDRVRRSGMFPGPLPQPQALYY